MNKTFLIAQREYLENLKTKTFWIGILMFPVILSVSILLPMWLEKVKDARRFTAIDHSGFLLEEILKSASAQDIYRFLGGWSVTEEGKRALLGEIPEETRTVLKVVEEAGRSSVWQISQYLVFPEKGAEELPEAIVPALRQSRETFLKWWRDLSPQQAGLLQKGLDRNRFHFVEMTEAERTPESLNGKIQSGEIFAYFEIGPDPVKGNEGCRYVSNNLTDREILNWFNGHASSVVKERRIASKGIDGETARWINQPLGFETNKVGASGAGEKVQAQDTAGQWAPVVFVYILWVSIFSVAQILLTNTIEEKSNRIIEVLLSSVSSFELMSGKIFGNAATGLTVIGSWIGFLFLGVTVIPRMFEGAPSIQLEEVISEPLYLGSFLVYFLLGYFLYAALLVGIGSVCTNPKEAQNLMLPIMLILFVPFMAMMPVAQDPNGTLARVLSYIPVFTPFVMMNRSAGPPPMVDYVGTTLLLLVCVPLFFWGASRVFRIGILMTGQPPKFFQMLRWLFSDSNRAATKN